jgi:dihydrofolate reductase
MSLDGLISGPDPDMENPLGIRGARLHEWLLKLAVLREYVGFEGGEVNASTQVVEEWLSNLGASIMGRNTFGGFPGAWDREKPPWPGWWGSNPPFHHPVFVLTHYARESIQLEGGTSFTFVTDGIESALRQARAAAAGRDVALIGGAETAGQYLTAGLVDEMEINLVPILLGSGKRLFEGLSDDMHGLRLIRTIVAPTAETPTVLHLKFAR